MNRRPPFPQALAAVALTLAMALLGSACRPSEPDGEPSPALEAPAPAPSPPPGPEAPAAPLGTDMATAEPAPPMPPPGGGPAAGLPQGRALQVGVLVVDGVYNTELAAPYDVFHHTVFHTEPGMNVFTVSPDGRPLATFEGLKLTPDHSFANAPAIDVLVVPSARGSMDKDLQNQALIDWIRRVGSGARHVISFCDGAFLLAKAGLLDGIPATTFPEDYQRFTQMFPKVDLRVNVSFVDAGKILTSQGGARSYDAAVHLVDRLYGTKVAQGVGKGLLVPWPPDPDTMSPRVVETPRPAQPAGQGS